MLNDAMVNIKDYGATGDGTTDDTTDDTTDTTVPKKDGDWIMLN